MVTASPKSRSRYLYLVVTGLGLLLSAAVARYTRERAYQRAASQRAAILARQPHPPAPHILPTATPDTLRRAEEAAARTYPDHTDPLR